MLTKLQIVRIEPKDLADAAALLLDVSLDATGIDVSRFVAPLAADWRFFHTTELNLAKLQAFADQQLESSHATRIRERIGVLRGSMERTPKTVRWKIRARIGERLTWYEMPEELD